MSCWMLNSVYLCLSWGSFLRSTTHTCSVVDTFGDVRYICVLHRKSFDADLISQNHASLCSSVFFFEAESALTHSFKQMFGVGLFESARVAVRMQRDSSSRYSTSSIHI